MEKSQNIIIHLGYPCCLGQEWELTLFYGIAEPISHFTDPLTGKAGTEESAKLAMQYSFFHWDSFRGHYTQWSL